MAAPSDTNFGSKGATSKYMFLVPLFDLKFLHEFAAGAGGTSNRRHERGRLRASNLPLPRIVAAPANRPPFRVLADPLGNIGRRRHRALRRRPGLRELKMLLFALGWRRQRAHRDDQLNQPHTTCSTFKTLSADRKRLPTLGVSSRRAENLAFPDHRHVSSKPAPRLSDNRRKARAIGFDE